MARPSGLGRGLGSLIPADLSPTPANDDRPRLEELAVESIRPNPHQPRVHFDEESLAELAASIAEIGVLQPVLVRPAGDGTYELIAGERRWRAARRAKLAVIPAVVRDTDDLGAVERALVENLHRKDLTVLEEGAAYQQLIEDFSLTHDQVAVRVGKSRSAVTNTLRVLSLPPAVQSLLADGRLSAGHAKALLATPDRALQERLARQAAAESWSVRVLEEAARDPARAKGVHDADAAAGESATAGSGSTRSVDGAGIASGTRLRAPGLLELETLLSEHLSTRVAIKMGKQRGAVTVDFADLEDLERIYYRMTAPITTDSE